MYIFMYMCITVYARTYTILCMRANVQGGSKVFVQL